MWSCRIVPWESICKVNLYLGGSRVLTLNFCMRLAVYFFFSWAWRIKGGGSGAATGPATNKTNYIIIIQPKRYNAEVDTGQNEHFLTLRKDDSDVEKLSEGDRPAAVLIDKLEHELNELRFRTESEKFTELILAEFTFHDGLTILHLCDAFHQLFRTFSFLSNKRCRHDSDTDRN